MVAIGMGLTWIGYTIGMYGYCLVRGYDVPFTQLLAGTWAGPGAREGGGTPVLPAAAGKSKKP